MKVRAAWANHILCDVSFRFQSTFFKMRFQKSFALPWPCGMIMNDLFFAGRPKFRRSRTIFNPEQIVVLEQHFEKYKYPDLKRRKIISEEIGLPEERIRIWFQNRRAKGKRQVDQQVKLQKMVDEAMGGTSQEVNRFHAEPGKCIQC